MCIIVTKGVIMEHAIGVIGGVGPYAGIDLVKKVFDQTIATTDQEHIDLYLTSCPSIIPDRTGFLLSGGENPADGIYRCFSKLASIGATAIVIPCNTAHAPAIYGEVARHAAVDWPHVQFLNMIAETCSFLDTLFPQGAVVGLMATLGTHSVGIYRHYLQAYPRLELVEPDEAGRQAVHGAIYDRTYGIKAVSPVTTRAVQILKGEAERLIERKAQAIILGCTELPLALHEGMVACPLVDPTKIVAQAAIKAVAPEKLRSA